MSNLTAGEVVPVTLGTSGTFTYQGTPGTFMVPGTSVTGVSIISILPASNTVQPGGTATYDVQLSNPTSSQVTYSVYTNIYATVSLNGNITLAPDSTVDDPLLITPYRDAGGQYSLHGHGQGLRYCARQARPTLPLTFQDRPSRNRPPTPTASSRP